MNEQITWEEYKQRFNNICNISGRVADTPKKSFKSAQGEQFYDTVIEVLRTSHAIDRVPITFSVSNLKFINEALEETRPISIIGELRTKFVPDGKLPDGNDKMKLIQSVFTRNIQPTDAEADDINRCYFRGELGRIKELRTTPNGKTVIDFTLRVYNKNNGNKKYSIPCIAWSYLAEWLSTLESGTTVVVDGRLQSREYTNQKGETRTVNEMSVNELAIEEPSEA